MIGSKEESIAKFKGGWKGGNYFKDFVKTHERPFVSGITAANKEMRQEKSVPSVPTTLGKGSK